MRKTALYLAVILSIQAVAHGQTLIIGDNYNVTSAGSGFALEAGVNAGINPSTTTRLTGSAANGLRYMNRAGKLDSAYSIGSNSRLRINQGTQSGRITLSADGTTPFDFSTALGADRATAANPIQYDITIWMDNNSPTNQRMSFAMGTVESSAGDWDFGLQVYKAGTDNFYTVAKRIDIGSSGLADQNSTILSMAPNSAGTEVSFLVRVTDAGSETSTFNSRLQISQDGGASWFYDTSTDSSLTSGWRLDGAGRFFSWDMAGNDSFVTYDNFSVTLNIAAVPEPSTYALAGLSGAALLWLRQRRGSNRK